MVTRALQPKLEQAAQQLPIITLIGPRQSGKTTLAKHLFANYTYINLELPDHRYFASLDPKGFFQRYKKGLILDEVQRLPAIFSYIQSMVDEQLQNGQFVLTGSIHPSLMQKISQSLAGRTRIFTLLPLSLAELQATPYRQEKYLPYLLKGFYPRLYGHGLTPSDWLPSYIQTYVERDVRQMTNVRNLSVFQNFIKLCAGHAGQLINYTAFSNALGVHETTIKEWFSMLEASYIAFTLKPYYNNFNKRLVKTPKLYFYDTGLACVLLGITNLQQLQFHTSLGPLFENFVIVELLKMQFNQGLVPNIYFWRESSGTEVDCLLEHNGQVIPIEIKSTQTLTSFATKNFKRLQKVMGARLSRPYIVYGGEQSFTQGEVQVTSWKDLNTLMAVQ